MTGLRKAVGLALLATAGLWPRPSAAMEIRQFDRMAAEDQQHYVAFLVTEAQKLLVEQGRGDLAARVHQLFRDIPPGEQLSPGEAQFRKHLDGLLEHVGQVPGVTFQIEEVLLLTMTRNGIGTSRRFSRDLAQATRNRVFFQKAK